MIPSQSQFNLTPNKSQFSSHAIQPSTINTTSTAGRSLSAPKPTTHAQIAGTDSDLPTILK